MLEGQSFLSFVYMLILHRTVSKLACGVQKSSPNWSGSQGLQELLCFIFNKFFTIAGLHVYGSHSVSNKVWSSTLMGEGLENSKFLNFVLAHILSSLKVVIAFGSCCFNTC
jgi:hypothetical protein